MKHSKLKEISLRDIHIDPKRFQFRTSAPQEPNRLNLKRTISVYHDPKQKKMFVVNGHHTVGQAKKLLSSHSFKAHQIKADSPEEARLTGALQNIIENNASEQDTERTISEIEAQPEEVQRRVMSETDRYLKMSKARPPTMRTLSEQLRRN